MPSKKEKALGSGLNALFPNGTPLHPEKLPVSQIEPRQDQPRTYFDDASLEELSNSISLHGLLQPIAVRPLKSGNYQIVAGERRWRAAKLAGLVDVPVRILEIDDMEAHELALIENLQREDLNPIEEANGYLSLIQDHGMTQDAVSKTLGLSRAAVSNTLRLLKLPEEVIQMLKRNELTAGHARALLTIKPEELQIQAAHQIIDKALSVRQAEQLAASLMKPVKKKTAPTKSEGLLRQIEALGEALGRKVQIAEKGENGHITIEFRGADDREALLQQLLSLK